MRSPRLLAASSALLLCVVGASVITATEAHAATAAVDTDIHISEVFADGGATTGADAAFSHDFIELTNTGSQDETLTGWSLKDDAEKTHEGSELIDLNR